MSYTTEHKKKFDDLSLQIKNQSQIRKSANGGNSILFTYPPSEEHLYINEAKRIYSSSAAFIDVSVLLVDFIDSEGWDSFKSTYNTFKSTPHELFKSEDPDTDLFDLIIQEIVKADSEDMIPFLIRSGCLLGTGIENVNIMENRTVMGLRHPLVVFYPSVINDSKLYFLNFKPASKYRCVVVK